MTTNYLNTFIVVSPDTRATEGTVPPRPESIAGRQHALLTEEPYRYTSDELLFEIHFARHRIADADRETAHKAFFARAQACLRASPLVRQYGWGIHHDGDARVALYAMESEIYAAFARDRDIAVRNGMRHSRK